MTKKSVLLVIGALVLVVLISALGTIRAMRPSRPDLSQTREWTLVKVEQAASSPREIRIYLLKHLSSTWDPYTVEQNKIVVLQEEKPQEFMWPSDREYAAGWCEVVRLSGGRAAVLLFESPASLRIVLFDNGRFVFRPDKDELLSATDIRYTGTGRDGLPEFAISEAGTTRTLRWAPESGFAENLATSAKIGPDTTATRSSAHTIR